MITKEKPDERWNADRVNTNRKLDMLECNTITNDRQQTFTIEVGKTSLIADQIATHLKNAGVPIVRSWRGHLYVANRVPARVGLPELTAIIETHCQIFKGGLVIDPPAKLVSTVSASSVWEVVR